MKLVITSAILSLFLVSPGYALQSQEKEKEKDKPPQQQEPKRPDSGDREREKNPERERPAERDKAQDRKQQEQQDKERERQDRERAQPPDRRQQEPQRQERERTQPPAERQRPAERPNQDRRMQQDSRGTRGGGRRIPADKFRASFGREHTFHVHPSGGGGAQVQGGGGQRFQYAGYWFEFVDAWPGDWDYDDDFYIDYIDDEYYLYDLRHPGVRIIVIVVE
jgi:hypothetical protein